jgi:hypothetical protein
VVSKGSRTSPEPCFDPLIFPQKSAFIYYAGGLIQYYSARE